MNLLLLRMLVVLVSSSCWLGGCSGGDSEFASDGRSGDPRSDSASLVIVYMIDALRADHMGLYGYERPTTPRIDALAGESVVFDAAYAPSSWTRASVGSLFTGLLPSRHGAVRRENRLRDDVATLAEQLRTAGFECAGFVSNPNVIANFGFDRGFDVYMDVDSTSVKTDAEEVQAAALQYLGRSRGQRFVYIHTIDPHDPYQPPEPFASRLARPPNAQGETSREALARKGVDAYDGEIAYADHAVGEFLAALRRLELYDDALLVIVSDHGEELGDHGGLRHGRTLFEEVIRIPMLIRFPKARFGGKRVVEPVRLLDIMPTLLEQFGVEAPVGLDGASFLGLVARGRDSAERLLFFEQNLHQDALTGLREGDFKVITRTSPVSRRRVEFYDLGSDPAERENLRDVRAGETKRLLERLAAIESSLNGGHHLEIVNGKGLPSTLRMEARLTLDAGVLGDIQATDLESGDEVRLAPDGRHLELRLELRNVRNPTGRHPKVLIDVDRVRFVIEPAEAVLRWRASLDGRELESMLVMTGGSNEPARVSLPWNTTADAQELLLVGPGLRTAVATESPYMRLHRVRVTPQVEATMDSALSERLEALGYLEEADGAGDDSDVGR